MAPAGAPAAPAPGPSNVVIISKIPEGITEQQVAAAAGRFNDVLKVSLRPADMDGPGWSIVAFASPELAKAAKERMDGKPFPGQPITSSPIEVALGEGLYGDVQPLDQESPWKEARSPQGHAYYYHAVTRQTTWVKPAFTPDRNAQAGKLAQSAISSAQATVAAKTGSATPSNSEALTSTASGPVGANLFVYHIPHSWDDKILLQHFEHFGRLVSCRIQKDDSGRSRGFGFISYDAAPSAQAAIAGMHGFPVEGKWLKVQLKKGDATELGDKAPPPPPTPAQATAPLGPSPGQGCGGAMPSQQAAAAGFGPPVPRPGMGQPMQMNGPGGFNQPRPGFGMQGMGMGMGMGPGPMTGPMGGPMVQMPGQMMGQGQMQMGNFGQPRGPFGGHMPPRPGQPPMQMMQPGGPGIGFRPQMPGCGFGQGPGVLPPPPPPAGYGAARGLPLPPPPRPGPY